MEKLTMILPHPLQRRDLIERLDRIALSADAKVLVEKVIGTTIEIGGRIFEFGRHLLTFVLDLAKRFRGVAFGVCMALTVSALVASTPLVGAFLAPMLSPLLLAFGLTMGALEDIRNGALRGDIVGFGKALETVKASD